MENPGGLGAIIFQSVQTLPSLAEGAQAPWQAIGYVLCFHDIAISLINTQDLKRQGRAVLEPMDG